MNKYTIIEAIYNLTNGGDTVPSYLSMLLSSSKCNQAKIFNDYIIDQTYPIWSNRDLYNLINVYNRDQQLITKDDVGSCGMHIRLWNNFEELYSTVINRKEYFPFVIQPRVFQYSDMRVIIVDDYIEAYYRGFPATHSNTKSNLRKNVSLGAESIEFNFNDPEKEPLSSNIKIFCKNIMSIGKFPYAHIDLFIINGDIKLSEISLNGGTVGSKINHNDLKERKNECKKKLLEYL